MKRDSWILYGLIAITSTTTIMLLNDGTLFGFVRAVGVAAVIDGFVVYWENKSNKLLDENDRKKAYWMMWGGVAIIFGFGVAFAGKHSLPAANEMTLDIFGFSFLLTFSQAVDYFAYLVSSVYIALTVGIMLVLRSNDHETKAERKQTEALAQAKQVELTAYETAYKAVKERLGVDDALRKYEQELTARGNYTPAEIAEMVSAARYDIEIAYGRIPANIPAKTKVNP